jgi:GDPmannose 4,6-dehydratase
MPDEIYNLGCQSHVRVSFDTPVYTTESIATGTLNLLEILRRHPSIKLYQASSSEMFGGSPPPQNENTPFSPHSTYASAKVNAYHNTRLYREAYGLFICNGILFNHEGERRGETFVTRKITRAATRIKLGLQDKLILGNLEAKRDWGYAKDFVEAMWLMMQQDTPDDFVIATGESHSVQEFVEEAFALCDLDWKKYVVTDDNFKRPSEVSSLLGDYSKANRLLGWSPSITFKELTKLMIKHDYDLARKERRLEDL